MKNIRERLSFYAITDNTFKGRLTLEDKVKSAIEGKITCLQLRDKVADDEALLRQAMHFSKLCHKKGVAFIVNDSVDIAIKSSADGVHIGQSDMDVKRVREIAGDNMIIGVTAKTVEQAIAAENGGADYLGVGAVFGTSTKPDATYITTRQLREIANAVSIPVVAIGGICEQNIMQLSGSNISGVAVASAIFSGDDTKDRCERLKKCIDIII